jgi:molybdate/tungstate transport system permease protein
MERRSDRLFFIIFLIVSGVLLTFILLPLARLLCFLNPKTAGVIADRSVIVSLWNSVSLSFVTALIALLVGVPTAFLISQRIFGKFGKIVETIVDLPLAIPHTVVGISLLFIIGRRGVIGSLFYNTFDFKITGTKAAIVIAMLFVSLPYTVDSAKEGFKKVDPSLVKSAMVLGAPMRDIFKDVYFPLAKSSIFSGFMLTWARAISEFGAVVILAYYPMTAPVKIYDAFSEYSLSTSGAIAAYLLLVCLAIFLTLRFSIGRKNGRFIR